MATRPDLTAPQALARYGASAVANILAVWDAATSADQEYGAVWYATVRDYLADIAEVSGLDTSSVIVAFAALSPQVKFARNVAMLRIVITAHLAGIVSARDLKAQWGVSLGLWGNVDKAFNALNGDLSPMVPDRIMSGRETGSLKVVRFAHNLLGWEDCVTVDVWAARIALGCSETVGMPEGVAYLALEAAYVEAAKARGVAPSVMQAATWVAARGDAY